MREHFRVAGSKHHGHTRAIFSPHRSRLVRDASCRKCCHIDKASGGDKGSGEGPRLPTYTYIYLIVTEESCREAIPSIAHPLAARGPVDGGMGKEGEGDRDDSTVGIRGPVPGRYFGNRRSIINRKSRKPLTSETVRRLYASYVVANHTLCRGRVPTDRLCLTEKIMRCVNFADAHFSIIEYVNQFGRISILLYIMKNIVFIGKKDG